MTHRPYGGARSGDSACSVVSANWLEATIVSGPSLTSQHRRIPRGAWDALTAMESELRMPDTRVLPGRLQVAGHPSFPLKAKAARYTCAATGPSGRRMAGAGARVVQAHAGIDFPNRSLYNPRNARPRSDAG
jgi:hypothetical protein